MTSKFHKLFRTPSRQTLLRLLTISMIFNFVCFIIIDLRWTPTYSFAFAPKKILYNYVQAEKKFESLNSVTFATHATPEYLFNLIQVTERWLGPVSIAIYAPGPDFQLAIRVIRHLRDCTNGLIRNYVTFHLFLEFVNPLKEYEYPLTYSEENTSASDCSWRIDRLARQTFRYQHKMTYPVNTARNIARTASTTLFILVCDLELYPSVNFIPQFVKMVAKIKPRSFQNPYVYVIPVFEVAGNLDPPKTKRQLVRMVRGGKAVPFHYFICKENHLIPKFEKWINLEMNNSLEIFLVSKSRPPWEPIFVGTNRDPFYDERLTWEGLEDKQTQMYEMCIMKYEFHILDEAFLVHSPGILSQVDKTWRKSFIRLSASTYLPEIKAEIRARHPIPYKKC